MLLCLQSVANVVVFFIKKSFKDFASVAKTLKMLQMLHNLQIVALSLNVANLWCLHNVEGIVESFKVLRLLQRP